MLSNLCAGRAQLLGVPAENYTARLVADTGAGLVAPPGDEAAFLAAARRLSDDPALRAEMGAKGRAYAEAHYDVDTLSGEFEKYLIASMDNRPLQ